MSFLGSLISATSWDLVVGAISSFSGSAKRVLAVRPECAHLTQASRKSRRGTQECVRHIGSHFFGSFISITSWGLVVWAIFFIFRFRQRSAGSQVPECAHLNQASRKSRRGTQECVRHIGSHFLGSFISITSWGLVVGGFLHFQVSPKSPCGRLPVSRFGRRGGMESRAWPTVFCAWPGIPKGGQRF